ncbi:MAG: hypothetical protein ACHQSE_14975, partial [Gemmatimonadales bacterium]
MKVSMSNRALRALSATKLTTRFVVGAAIAGLFIAACSKDAPSAPTSTGVLATITLTPATVSLPAGAPQQYTAVGKDASGNVVVITP